MARKAKKSSTKSKKAPKAEPKALEAGDGTATYVADGKSGKGDTRLTLDTSSVQSWGDNDRPVVVIRTESGHEIRLPMPRNVYVPSGQDVSSVSLSLTATAVKAEQSEADSGGVGSAILDRLIAGGNVPVIAKWLAREAGRSRVSKGDTEMAEALVAAQ